LTARPSVTALADDPHLVQALTTGVWAFEILVLGYETTSGAGGLKLGLAFSGTKTDDIWGGSGVIGGVQTVQGGVPFSSVLNSSGTMEINAASTCHFKITGSLTVTGAGNLSLQWAQVVSNANATNLVKGCYLLATKVG
jgi:hypothetical protein